MPREGMPAPSQLPETDWSSYTNEGIHDLAWNLIEEKEAETRHLPEEERISRMEEQLHRKGLSDATAALSEGTWKVRFTSPLDGEVMSIAHRPSSDRIL